MNKRGIGIFSFLLWIGIFSAIKKTKGQVYLEVIDKPIVFGVNTRLFCNISLVPGCCSNTVTWMRNHFVIVHHGVSVNVTKYTQIRTQKGFLLQIKPFEERDMYAMYSCLYGFQTASIDFATDENKYEKHPSSDDIRINENLDEKNDVFVIDIAFKAVLPMPKCILLSDDRDLKAQQIIKQHSNDLFYNVSIQMTLNNTFDDCLNNTTLKCSIGGYTMSHTLKHNISCFDIPEVKLDKQNDANVKKIIIPLLIGIFFVVMASPMYKHLYLSSKGQQQGESPKKIISSDTVERGERLEESTPLMKTREILALKPLEETQKHVNIGQNETESHVMEDCGRDETCENIRERKTATGWNNLKKTGRMVKGLLGNPKDQALAISNETIWKQRKRHKDQGEYDKNRGTCLFPPKNHQSRDPYSNIPVQREKRLTNMFEALSSQDSVK